MPMRAKTSLALDVGQKVRLKVGETTERGIQLRIVDDSEPVKAPDLDLGRAAEADPLPELPLKERPASLRGPMTLRAQVAAEPVEQEADSAPAATDVAPERAQELQPSASRRADVPATPSGVAAPVEDVETAPSAVTAPPAAPDEELPSEQRIPRQASAGRAASSRAAQRADAGSLGTVEAAEPTTTGEVDDAGARAERSSAGRPLAASPTGGPVESEQEEPVAPLPLTPSPARSAARADLPGPSATEAESPEEASSQTLRQPTPTKAPTGEPVAERSSQPVRAADAAAEAAMPDQLAARETDAEAAERAPQTTRAPSPETPRAGAGTARLAAPDIPSEAAAPTDDPAEVQVRVPSASSRPNVQPLTQSPDESDSVRQGGEDGSVEVRPSVHSEAPVRSGERQPARLLAPARELMAALALDDEGAIEGSEFSATVTSSTETADGESDVRLAVGDRLIAMRSERPLPVGSRVSLEASAPVSGSVVMEEVSDDPAQMARSLARELAPQLGEKVATEVARSVSTRAPADREVALAAARYLSKLDSPAVHLRQAVHGHQEGERLISQIEAEATSGDGNKLTNALRTLGIDREQRLLRGIADPNVKSLGGDAERVVAAQQLLAMKSDDPLAAIASVLFLPLPGGEARFSVDGSNDDYPDSPTRVRGELELAALGEIGFDVIGMKQGLFVVVGSSDGFAVEMMREHAPELEAALHRAVGRPVVLTVTSVPPELPVPGKEVSVG
jgi:hypothetical protein